MQAKNLEELELQQPFFERTLRPLGAAPVRHGSVASTSQSFSDRTEKRLALAGNPGDLRTADWLGIKVVGAVVGAIVFFLLFVIVGVRRRLVPHRPAADRGGRLPRLRRSRSSGSAAGSRSARRRSC